jgi:hypothetical protein
MAIGSILRLHGSWDTDAGRAWCQELPERVAAAPDDAVVYRARNVLVRLESPTGPVVVKAFGKGKWWRPKKSLSKAVESWDNGVRTLRLGVATPEPRAAVLATGTGGFYVCDWAAGCRSVWDLHDGLLADVEYTALAEFVARMHDLGVHHKDLTPGNILLRPEGAGFAHLLVDLNRMRFGPVSIGMGLAALAKLECHGKLVADYARARGLDPHAAQRRFARLTLIERTSRRFKNATRPWRRKIGM